MEVNNSNVITSSQAMTFILAIQIGIGLLTLPADVIENAGHDGWITVFISAGAISLALIAIIALCRRFGGKSILEINQVIFGKYIALIINILLVLYLIFEAVSNLKLITIAVGIWFFSSSPIWILTLYFLLPSMYLTYFGLKGMSRFNLLVYLFIPMTLGLATLNLPGFDYTQLLPIGMHGISGIVKSLPPSTFAYMGFETLLFIFPFIKDKQNIGKYALAGAAATTLLFVLFVVVSLGVFGEEFLKKRLFAVVGLARMIKLPVLERVDLYFLAMWIPGMLLAVNAYHFLAFNSFKKIFNIKTRAFPLIIISIIIFFASTFNEDANIVRAINVYSGYAAFIIGAPYPVILLLISLITGKGAKKKL
ncbi:MAG: hypothetical protein K0R31_1758 [Clostridiales bacterium]|nr:hypothetical protein [Clostridiales bacterium]